MNTLQLGGSTINPRTMNRRRSLNRFATITPYVTWGFIGLVVSYLVTIVAWNILQPRMFKCTDDVPFVPLPGPISDHKQAGDTPLPGWTWTKVRIARLTYLTTFFTLWLAIAAAPYWAHRLATDKSPAHPESPPTPPARP